VAKSDSKIITPLTEKPRNTWRGNYSTFWTFYSETFHPTYLLLFKVIMWTFQNGQSQRSCTRGKRVSQTADNHTEKINPFHLPTDQTWCSTQWTLALGTKKDFVTFVFNSKQIKIIFKCLQCNERSCISSRQGIAHQTAFLQTPKPAM
jgi:hypothetical protein